MCIRDRSNRASEVLKEEINLLGPLKLSQIDESKRNIVKIVRKLEQEGLISLENEPEDELIV